MLGEVNRGKGKSLDLRVQRLLTQISRGSIFTFLVSGFIFYRLPHRKTKVNATTVIASNALAEKRKNGSVNIEGCRKNAETTAENAFVR